MSEITPSMLHTLTREGYLEFPECLDAKAAKELHQLIRSNRPYDSSIFLSQDEWEASPKSHNRTNPGPGYNLLEKIPQEKLDFIHKSPVLNSYLTQLLGKDFTWYQKKLICRIPSDMIPPWLYAQIKDSPTNSFGAFIKPQYRDMMYFYNVDMHQDIADWPRWPHKEHRLLTLLIYLDETTLEDAPLIVMPGTHVLGATPYQHHVEHIEGERWKYCDTHHNCVDTSLKQLTGTAGYVGLWHTCLLHGSHSTQNGKFRVSLRYLVGRSEDNNTSCMLDEVNTHIRGPLTPDADYTAGANARADGFWNLKHNDFTRGSRIS